MAEDLIHSGLFISISWQHHSRFHLQCDTLWLLLYYLRKSVTFNMGGETMQTMASTISSKSLQFQTFKFTKSYKTLRLPIPCVIKTGINLQLSKDFWPVPLTLALCNQFYTPKFWANIQQVATISALFFKVIWLVLCLPLSNLSILAAAWKMGSQKWVLHFNAHLVSMATFLLPCFIPANS